MLEPEELVQLELRSTLNQYKEGTLLQNEKAEAISIGAENAVRKTHR